MPTEAAGGRSLVEGEFDSSLRGGLEPFVAARSVAVVGASDRRGVHRAAIGNLLGASEKVWGVHPRRREVGGMACFPTAADLPEAPDLGLLLVGHRNVLSAATELLDAGVGGLVVPGLGAEAREGGATAAAELRALCDAHGTALVGVNCMGVAVPAGLSPWIGTLGRDLRAGSVAAIVQSGQIGEALAALGPRVGFRCIASLGAETNRDVADWIGFLAADEDTTAIALFLESVRRPAALKAALEQAAVAGKPVVCLRVGRSEAGARAAIAHTDAILTPARAFAALARQTKMIEVDDFAELVEVMELLGASTRVRGTRLAAVTQSGGEAALLADLAEAIGAALPRFDGELRARLAAVLPTGVAIDNPLDAWTIDDTAGVYGQVFELLAASGDFDVVTVQLDQSPYVGAMEAEVAARIVAALAAALDRQPVAGVVLSGQATEPVAAVREAADAAGIPVLRGARPALRALTLVGGWAPAPCLREDDHAYPYIAIPGAEMGEVEAAQLLGEFGVKFTRCVRVADRAEAIAAAAGLGYPLVLKRDQPGHRAAAGGVILGIESDADLEGALERIAPPAVLAAQVRAGPEVYCGAHQHAGYGPIVCVGWGGLMLEQAPSIVCGLAPLTAAEAAELTGEVPGLARAVSADLMADLVATVAAVGELAARLAPGASVDINPLILDEDAGAIAVDALIVGKGAPRAPIDN